jgi:hypothetical protein
LNKEDLTFKATDKEFFAPDITFTWFSHIFLFEIWN